MRRLAIWFLLLQGVGGVAWWITLILWPGSRQYFRPMAAPDSVLLAFAAADLILYAFGSLLAAFGIWKRKSWVATALAIHVGAAAYAALYCIQLWSFAEETWLAAFMMLPSLVFPGLILAKLSTCMEEMD